MSGEDIGNGTGEQPDIRPDETDTTSAVVVPMRKPKGRKRKAEKAKAPEKPEAMVEVATPEAQAAFHEAREFHKRCEAAIAAIEAETYFLDVGQSARVARFITDPDSSRRRLALMDVEQFRKLRCNCTVQVTRDKSISDADLWLRSPNAVPGWDDRPGCRRWMI